jgi:hypothetical protein
VCARWLGERRRHIRATAKHILHAAFPWFQISTTQNIAHKTPGELLLGRNACAWLEGKQDAHIYIQFDLKRSFGSKAAHYAFKLDLLYTRGQNSFP